MLKRGGSGRGRGAARGGGGGSHRPRAGEKTKPAPPHAKHAGARIAAKRAPKRDDSAAQKAEEEAPARKKSKFAIPTLDEFDGDLSLWFDALHCRAAPSLTKLERGVDGNGVFTNANITFKRIAAEPAGVQEGEEEEKEDGMHKVWEEIRGDVEAADGQEHVALVLASSADRCCVIAKHFKKHPEVGQIAKLFARHMTAAKQGEFLKGKKEPTRVSLGTPNRVLKLLQQGDVKPFKYLVIDMKEDLKKFTLLTIPQISQDLFQLCREHVLQSETPITILFVE